MDDPYEIVKETARRYRECVSYSDEGRIFYEERNEVSAARTLSMTFQTSYERPYQLRLDWQHDDIENQGLISWSGIQFLNARKAKMFKSDKMLANEQKMSDQFGIKTDDKLVKAIATLCCWSRLDFKRERDRPLSMLELASSSTYGASMVAIPLIFGVDRDFSKCGLNALNRAVLLNSSVVKGHDCYVLATDCSSYPFLLKYFISKEDFVVRRAIAYSELDRTKLPQQVRNTMLQNQIEIEKTCSQALFEFDKVQRQ